MSGRESTFKRSRGTQDWLQSQADARSPEQKPAAPPQIPGTARKDRSPTLTAGSAC